MASDQVGAMAVLKQLIAESAVTIGLQANVPPKPTGLLFPCQRVCLSPVTTKRFSSAQQPSKTQDI